MSPIREHNDDDSSCDSKKLMVHSRQMTRLAHMFWSAGTVVKWTKVWQRKDEAGRKALEDSASQDDKQIYALVKLLVSLEPDVVMELARGGRGACALTELTEFQLSRGQSNAKAEDMRKVRSLLSMWRIWAHSQRPDAEDPLTRGLHNSETAYFLSSLNTDWDNLDERRKFMNGEMEMSELDFPRLCYPEGKGDKIKPWVDIFRGELLLRAASSIIFSPASSRGDRATTMVVGGSRGHRCSAKSRGPIGLAKRYDMTEVTTPFIAYVTVVVRHALTSDQDYSDDGSGFDYELFYNEIREYLEDPKHAQVTAKVVNFWNNELFGCFRFRKATGVRTENAGTRAALDAALEAGEDLGLSDAEETQADAA
ncbi:hypothetical protein RhiJN_09768 [Ceratobasidium sp. AG-Ba]|nr:hypothetical protein RhiJN_09768 [Ceratobasidium sp. AG-Ba]